MVIQLRNIQYNIVLLFNVLVVGVNAKIFILLASIATIPKQFQISKKQNYTKPHT